jgi:hypothetical protein
MLVKKEIYVKLRPPLIGKNLRTRECTNNLCTVHFVHIRALISLYQISTDKCINVLVGHHYNNNTRNSNIFQPLEVYLQGE